MADKKKPFCASAQTDKKPNIEELKKKLEELEKQKEEYLAGWRRTRANFLNYQKDELERVGELIKYAGAGLVLKLLPILDNFEIAEEKINEENPEGKPLASYGASIKGLLQIKTQIQDFFKSQGVEEIKAIGQKFDPNLHEVVEQVEVKDKDSGIVIEEVQKGYKIHGKVLRPAKVKISK